MRVLACGLAVLACSAPAAAAPHASCPPGGGTLEFRHGGEIHAVSLASCRERLVGTAPAATRAVPGVRTSGARAGTQRIWMHGSMAADGLDLLVVSAHGGSVHHLGVTLPYPDYLTWCDGRLVFAAGSDRVAIHGKRLLVAAPPDWRVRPLWDDRARSFASPSCEPGSRAVAVLTQRSSVNARFFATRWRLWRVGLDGSRRVLDVPPPGWADEQPAWSPDGRTLAFVRERNGYGRVMALRSGRLYGSLTDLGYALGYYGHHDWGLAWAR